jgi:hypothetical protein
LDRKSIEFLVHQMRLELERIPENEMRALVEAQTKCGEDEFSDARLERFLRCEGMNAKVRRKVCELMSFFLPQNRTGSLIVGSLVMN